MISDILGQWPYPIISFASIAGMLLGVFSAAKLADDVFGVGPAAKKFGKFFRNSARVPTFARAYIGATFLIDRIYGERILSIRAVFVSFLITAIWISILLATTIIIYGHSAWVFNSVFTHQVIYNFWGFMIVGLAVDYLSISAARSVLNQSVEYGSTGKLFWLILAAAINSIVFFVLYAGAKSIYLSQPIGSPLDQILTWIDTGLNLNLGIKTLTDWQFSPTSPGIFNIRNGNAEVVYAFPEGMLFFSSQLALVWLALHMLAHWLYFSGFMASRLMKHLVAESALETRPLQSAATIVGLLSLLPLWVIAQIWHYSSALLAVFSKFSL